MAPKATHCREGEAGYNVFLEGTMGDTRKSPTISTQPQKIASQAASDPGGVSASGACDSPPILIPESSLARIKELATLDPEMVFTSLAHRIDLHLLGKSFKQLRKNESTGVDKVTANMPKNLIKTSIIYTNGCVEVSTLHLQ